MKLMEIVYLGTKIQLFFILTEPCRAQSSETPCDQPSIGTMSFDTRHSFIADRSIQTRSAPGYRITNHIDPSRFALVDLDTYVERREAILAHAIENGDPTPNDEEEIRHRVKVYIYCPPCACQVATALAI